MATQFISTNKNYKRLYDAPLDPSSVYDNIESLREYLKDPTCYIDQLVGCNGKAYIIIEKDGVKDIKEIGTVNSSGQVNGLLFIGDIEPTDEQIVWIDTSEVDEPYSDNISDLVIEEFRTIIKGMNDEIKALKERIIILESGNIKPSYNGYTITDEDDNILIDENNDILIF